MMCFRSGRSICAALLAAALSACASSGNTPGNAAASRGSGELSDFNYAQPSQDSEDSRSRRGFSGL